jgi:hypothetical protein
MAVRTLTRRGVTARLLGAGRAAAGQHRHRQDGFAVGSDASLRLTDKRVAQSTTSL